MSGPYRSMRGKRNICPVTWIAETSFDCFSAAMHLHSCSWIEQQNKTGDDMKLSKLSRSIEGCVAFITGAASGMGEATAKLFADEGAKVALVDMNEEGLQRVVSEIEGAGYPVRGACSEVY